MFKNMHRAEEPLIICNVWDVPSAKVAQKIGFLAIGTSSAAIASNLGKDDGENIKFNDFFTIEKLTVLGEVSDSLREKLEPTNPEFRP